MYRQNLDPKNTYISKRNIYHINVCRSSPSPWSRDRNEYSTEVQDYEAEFI